MSDIRPATWHGLAAWALESHAVRVVIVPELGAKIVSLFDKRANHEWLVGPMRPPQPAAYGASFVEQDMSGWDEMFPTINACEYPAPGMYQGRPLPDHGEVWPLPWMHDGSHAEALTFSVEGRALPYHFRRTARLSTADVLQLDYRVTNAGAEAFHYLWAAHPQFTADADTVIVLPLKVTQMYNVVVGKQWGEAGQRYAWPNAIAPDGRRWQLDRIGPASRHDCRKFYVPPETQVNWAALDHRHSGSLLRLEWSPEQTPYLGIWVDEGTYNVAPVVALEPSNGFYDILTLAYQNGRAMKLAPGMTHTWTLKVRIESAR